MNKRKHELSPEAKKARKDYMKKWKKEHPDNVREHCRRYWEKKALQLATDKKEG